MKYYKNPHVVEALCYTDSASLEKIAEMAGTAVTLPTGHVEGQYIKLHTPTGLKSVVKGDWITKDKDSFYLVKADVFEKYYAAVQ